jgi:Rieske 2Fe-2S family protein
MRVLTDVKAALPASWYYDAEHYQRELAAIWYRDWVCVGRTESLAEPGSYFVTTIGNQKIIVTTSTAGELKAFHNTCRHRGSRLCREDNGRFLNGRIVCPYHSWTFSTDGQLLATPGRIETDDFDAANYSLYQVHVDSWGGFVFINLAEDPASGLLQFLGEEPDYLRSWPLDSMRSVHQETIRVACNWKLFWENYSECYHCPRVHPELCKVMPVYKKAVFAAKDLPDWEPAYEGDEGRGAVGEGIRTWTASGQSNLPTIEGPTKLELKKGVLFGSVTGSMYLAAHPDYVRSVRVVPTGPESIELVVDWLLPGDYTPGDDIDMDAIYEFGRTVIEQDGDVCELNQQGLHSMRHENGVLVSQEFELWDFHQWLRERLVAAPDAGSSDSL